MIHTAALVLLLFGTGLAHSAATASLDGIYLLVQRQLPEHVDSFTFTLVSGEGDNFVLSDATKAGGIDIQCTTVSACARGLYT